MLSLLDSIKLWQILIAAIFWLILFAGLYAMVPCFAGELAQLKGVANCKAESIAFALYTSVVTMFSLGYSDIYPVGWLRLFAAIQVMGGVVLAGLAIASIVAMPASHARRAIKACSGDWIESIELPNGRRFYSFTKMYSDGVNLLKTGQNFDPGGEMHNTQYLGKIITNLFPTLMSVYQNDQLSTDYTEGVFRFDVQMGANGRYKSYVGGCLDKKHGGRDRILARRITDENFLQKLDNGSATAEELSTMITVMFPANSKVSAAATSTTEGGASIAASPTED